MVKRVHPLVIAVILAAPCSAAELSEADFLGELPVVLTASRLSQPVQDAPNSISVIDRAMIEASGFQNLADLFLLVPGFYVGQKNGFDFTVASGLVDEFSRQMQVLVDGRSVYLPSVGGVQWDALPLAIADIDRIEVVRGPDAASYGANAMTGVINIITRHPAEVEGRTLSATVGADQRRDILFRWAGGDTSMHRVTLGWHQDDGFPNIFDSTRAPQFNYSGDIDVGPGRSLNVQMGYIGGTRGEGDPTDGASLPHDEHVDSEFQQVDYRASLADGGEWLVKAYHNYLMDRETVPVGPITSMGRIGNTPIYLLPGSYARNLKADRWHAEAQWSHPLSDGVRLSLGGYGRRDAVNSPLYFGRNDDLVDWSWGVFTHAEWRLAHDWLLNFGAMWEDHDLVGSRLSPRVALSWQPSPNHTLRLGVSRAYRNPVEFEKNADWRLSLMTTAPAPYSLQTKYFYTSNSAIQPESNLSREIGYLGNWPELGLTAEARVHVDSMHDLIGQVGTSYPYTMANVGDSLHRGVDGQVRWRFAPRSFVQLNYAYLHIDTTLSQTPYFPPHIGGLLVSHRFANDVDISLGYYQSDTLVMLSSDKPPAYHRTNLRIAKEFKQGGHRARVAFILQDLGEPNYGFNYSPSVPSRDQMSRQGFLQYQVDY